MGLVRNDVLVSSWTRAKQILVMYELRACGFYLFMYVSGQFRQSHMTSGSKMEKMWLSLAWGVTDIPLPWHLSFRSAPLLISTQTAWIINPSNLPLHAPPVATSSSGHTHLNLGHTLVYSKMTKETTEKFSCPRFKLILNTSDTCACVFQMPNIYLIAYQLNNCEYFTII